MKQFILILFPAILAVSGFGTELHYNAGEYSLIIPNSENWEVDQSGDEMIIFNKYINNASVSVIKHKINRSGIIENEADLIEAISNFYKELGLIYEIGDSLVYHLSQQQIDFSSEFAMYDPEFDYNMRIYLSGIIVRAENGEQFFFLLYGQVPEDLLADNFDDIRIIINSFDLTMPLARSVYPPNSLQPYLLVLLVMALTVFFFARNRRIQKSKNPLGLDSSSFWRCQYCRKTNHIELTDCNRCGKPREKSGHIEIK